MFLQPFVTSICGLSRVTQQICLASAKILQDMVAHALHTANHKSMLGSLFTHSARLASLHTERRSPYVPFNNTACSCTPRQEAAVDGKKALQTVRTQLLEPQRLACATKSLYSTSQGGGSKWEARATFFMVS